MLNGVLMPYLLNSPFASLFLINLDILLLHIAHFDNIIALPLLVLETFESMFSVFFYLHFKQYDSILYTCIVHKLCYHSSQIYLVKKDL